MKEPRRGITTTLAPTAGRGSLGTVVAGGLVAGALDIAYACVFWGLKADLPARRIFQSVAAGLLGEASFDGGWATALLGLGLHFLIAVSMALTYYLVARRVPLLVRRAIPFGAAYGLLLYGIMNHVVVPLSRAGGGSRNGLWIGLTILVHMFLIGVPIAVFSRRALLGGPDRTGGARAAAAR